MAQSFTRMLVGGPSKYSTAMVYHFQVITYISRTRTPNTTILHSLLIHSHLPVTTKPTLLSVIPKISLRLPLNFNKVQHAPLPSLLAGHGCHWCTRRSVET